MNVICTNADCSQRDIPKDSAGFAVEDIKCGECGQPVEAIATARTGSPPR
jgi:hypothetical protein